MADTSPQTALNLTGSVVAILLVLFLGTGVAALTMLEIPQANHDIILVLITAIAANVGNIINFFFGSSVNNKKLADTANMQAQTIASAQAALAPLVPTDPKTVTIQPGQSAKVNATEGS